MSARRQHPTGMKMTGRVASFVALIAALAGVSRSAAAQDAFEPPPPPPDEDVQAPPPPSAQPPAQAPDQMTFEQQLSPYGRWVDTPEYGRVWVPGVGPDWQPYADGQWVSTRWGWSFAAPVRVVGPPARPGAPFPGGAAPPFRAPGGGRPRGPGPRVAPAVLRPDRPDPEERVTADALQGPQPQLQGPPHETRPGHRVRAEDLRRDEQAQLVPQPRPQERAVHRRTAFHEHGGDPAPGQPAQDLAEWPAFREGLAGLTRQQRSRGDGPEDDAQRVAPAADAADGESGVVSAHRPRPDQHGVELVAPVVHEPP